MYILRVKSLIISRILGGGGFQLRRWLLLDLVQPDRRFQHKQHIEALFADVLHYFGYLLRFRDGFVNGFTQLLDETTKSLVQVIPPIETMRRGLTYLTSDDSEDQSESTDW